MEVAHLVLKAVYHGHLSSISLEHSSLRFPFPPFHSSCSSQQWLSYCKLGQDFYMTSLNLSLVLKLLIRPQSHIIKTLQSHVICVLVVGEARAKGRGAGSMGQVPEGLQSQNSPPLPPLHGQKCSCLRLPHGLFRKGRGGLFDIRFYKELRVYFCFVSVFWWWNVF